ncbi:MAG TPA: hypothetical protein VMX14_06995 [Anaerolineae bacterium]|nr:hypothetical protein [Anaerolineae bacterium]
MASLRQAQKIAQLLNKRARLLKRIRYMSDPVRRADLEAQAANLEVQVEKLRR